MAHRLDRAVRHAGAVLIAVTMLVPQVAAKAESLEAAVKAAYLYRFGDFVEWPPATFAAPASALNLCLTGRVPFAASLAAEVAGKRVAGRPLVVRRLARVTRASGCQILYIGGGDRQRIAEALSAVRGAGVLTVTDVVGDGEARSIIAFVVKDNHVRFAIDSRQASASHLVISSKLLSLALLVTDP